MTGKAKRGKTPADKAARKPVKIVDFVTRVLAWARAARGQSGVAASGSGGKS